MNLVMPGLSQQTPAPPQAFRQQTAPVDAYDLEPVKKALAPYVESIESMAEQAKAFTITDDASQSTAVEMAGQVKSLAKKIEDARLGFVAEPNLYVKRVNGLCNGFKDRLTPIESGLKTKIGEYKFRKDQERARAEKAAREAAIEAQRKIDKEARLAREVADKAAAEAAKAAAEAARAGDADSARLAEIAKAEQAKAEMVMAMPVPQVEAPVIPQSTGPVRTSAGTASVKTVWKFEVTDAQAVPREFMVVDEKAIRKAVSGGVRNIAGVRIFETSEVAIRA